MSSETVRPFAPIGHEELCERFRRAWERGRLASSFLFVGDPGVGKRRFANWLAAGILCGGPDFRGERSGRDDVREDRPLDPCGVCRSCRMLAADSHPDLHVIEKPEDRSEIPVELLIGDREHRMREGLLADIALKPAVGRRKVAILDDADHLNEAGSNCLLKTLEEPPPGTVLILIGTSEHRQLPTIRSRSQIIRFDPLTEAQVAEVLAKLPIEADDEARRLAAHLSQGSVRTALDWLDEALHAFRDRLLRQLESDDPTDGDFCKELIQFVEGAGSEARARRRRLERVLDLAIDLYRERMHRAGEARDPSIARRAADAIQVVLEVQRALHANAHLPTLIDAWLIELGQVLRGETPASETFGRAV
jgi:DNA polymerase III subunit delta'